MQEALPYKTWQQITHQPFLTRLPKPNPIPIDTKSLTKPLNNPTGPVEPITKPLNPNVTDNVRNMVSENAVIVFGKRGCCMSHVVKRLLQGLGVNPFMFEIEESDEDTIVGELETLVGGGGEEGRRLQFPAVFIGGELFGGLDRIMATHITGELVPVLKKAGALWL